MYVITRDEVIKITEIVEEYINNNNMNALLAFIAVFKRYYEEKDYEGMQFYINTKHKMVKGENKCGS